jgi:hypothetical protein
MFFQIRLLSEGAKRDIAHFVPERAVEIPIPLPPTSCARVRKAWLAGSATLNFQVSTCARSRRCGRPISGCAEGFRARSLRPTPRPVMPGASSSSARISSGTCPDLGSISLREPCVVSGLWLPIVMVRSGTVRVSPLRWAWPTQQHVPTWTCSATHSSPANCRPTSPASETAGQITKGLPARLGTVACASGDPGPRPVGRPSHIGSVMGGVRHGAGDRSDRC